MAIRVSRDQARKLGLNNLRGELSLQLRIELPWPPALNNLYATVRGRRVLSSRGRQYKAAVARCCDEQGIGHVKGRLRVIIEAFPPDHRRRDIDGLLKITLDGLKEAGCFEDDSQIYWLSIQRFAAIDVGALVVRVWGD